MEIYEERIIEIYKEKINYIQECERGVMILDNYIKEDIDIK